jgi:hypothetical protein
MALIKCRGCGGEVFARRANRKTILKTGLVFVVIDIFLWVFLFVVSVFVHATESVFVVLLLANPLAIVWMMAGIGGEQTSIGFIPETAWLILSGMLFYFFAGVVFGVLSGRTQKAEICPHCGYKYPTRSVLDCSLCVGWRPYVLIVVFVLLIMLYLRCR